MYNTGSVTPSNTAPAASPQPVQGQLADLRQENDNLRSRVSNLELNLERALNALGIDPLSSPPSEDRPFRPIV